MAKTVIARTLKPKRVVLPDEFVGERVQHDRVKPVQEFKTLAEQVAKSTVYFKNFYVPELRERYRFADRMKRIDICFPYARLGEKTATVVLCVDTPETELDVEICHQKKAIMKELGYHYCVIEKDSSLFEVLTQLGAI